MKKVLLFLLVTFVFSWVIQAEPIGIETVYTDLTAEKCKTVESNVDEGGNYRGECPGVGGYKLELLEGDIRQTINVIAPNGNKSELEFWSNVSGAFSAVGEKAEWRVTRDGKKIRPIALIIRYNTNEDPENIEKITSRLVVIKIADQSACITDIVEPIKDANQKARELADASSSKPCRFESVGVGEQKDKPVQPIEDPAKVQGPPDVIIADVADYSKVESPVWRQFASESELEKAREVRESYTIAYVWNKNGRISQVNFTYFSESGDSVEYWFHTYREDGSIEKLEQELRTFMDDIIVNRIETYDKGGKLIGETKTFRDLNTQKEIAPKEYMDTEVGRLYLITSDLPFFPMLSSGAGKKTDESAFIPSGWSLQEKITGDLNGDSLADSVLQIVMEDTEDENDRALIVLLKNSDGNFVKAADARNIILCSYCGGVKGGPPGIEIKNGVLLISQMSGSRAFTQYLHRFRYEPSSGRFLLIGEDISDSDGTGTTESTSTNYLTGKQVVTKTRYNERTDKEVVVLNQTRSVAKSKKYIEEVGL